MRTTSEKNLAPREAFRKFKLRKCCAFRDSSPSPRLRGCEEINVATAALSGRAVATGDGHLVQNADTATLTRRATAEGSGRHKCYAVARTEFSHPLRTRFTTSSEV